MSEPSPCRWVFNSQGRPDSCTPFLDCPYLFLFKFMSVLSVKDLRHRMQTILSPRLVFPFVLLLCFIPFHRSNHVYILTHTRLLNYGYGDFSAPSLSNLGRCMQRQLLHGRLMMSSECVSDLHGPLPKNIRHFFCHRTIV